MVVELPAFILSMSMPFVRLRVRTRIKQSIKQIVIRQTMPNKEKIKNSFSLSVKGSKALSVDSCVLLIGVTKGLMSGAIDLVAELDCIFGRVVVFELISSSPNKSIIFYF